MRLAVARKRRQLTKKALAENAGVAQDTLTRIENGETSDPESDTVAALARALSYPIGFFYLDDLESLSTDSVSFRSLSSLTARQRDAALAAGTIAFLLDDWVTDRFNLPPHDLLNLREENPAAAAAALRNYWRIGSKPIPHMTRLLEAKGVRVFSLSEENKNVDAFSCWRGDVPYIFLNTFKSAERSRFDAAHELGHLVMHVHGASGGRDVEKDADRFAAAFLIPRDDLISHMPMRLTSINQLITAKERWGVSVAALARNAFDAGLVTDWHYRELCKKISAAGYRTKEPHPRGREGSEVWKKVFESLWRDRLTKNDVANALCLPIDEIEAVLGGLYGEVPEQVGQRTVEALRAVN
jgi:Zn-dependent peptidase ImmA (M78 family)/DNA-binding XRE family transcriptional regulator